MSTRYILHGGDAQQISPENDLFYTEILSNISGEIKVLLVQFAAVEEKRETYRQRDRAQFERAKKDRIIHYQFATEKDFISQIAWADVVYFGGGTTPKLLDTLRQFSDLPRHFEGKTIAGESAGTNCLATYCYSKSGGILKGLGCVPIKLIPHFVPESAHALDSITEDLESLFLPTQQFKVFTI